MGFFEDIAGKLDFMSPEQLGLTRKRIFSAESLTYDERSRCEGVEITDEQCLTPDEAIGNLIIETSEPEEVCEQCAGNLESEMIRINGVIQQNLKDYERGLNGALQDFWSNYYIARYYIFTLLAHKVIYDSGEIKFDDLKNELSTYPSRYEKMDDVGTEYVRLTTSLIDEISRYSIPGDLKNEILNSNEVDFHREILNFSNGIIGSVRSDNTVIYKDRNVRTLDYGLITLVRGNNQGNRDFFNTYISILSREPTEEEIKQNRYFTDRSNALISHITNFNNRIKDGNVYWQGAKTIKKQGNRGRFIDEMRVIIKDFIEASTVLLDLILKQSIPYSEQLVISTINNVDCCGTKLEADLSDPPDFPEQPDKNGFSGFGFPTLTDLDYWKIYANKLTLQGLIPSYWTVGLIIGPARIKLPIIWRAINTFYTPTSIYVTFLTVNGVVVCPVTWVLHMNPVANDDSILLTLFRGGNQKIKSETGNEPLTIRTKFVVAKSVLDLVGELITAPKIPRFPFPTFGIPEIELPNVPQLPEFTLPKIPTLPTIPTVPKLTGDKIKELFKKESFQLPSVAIPQVNIQQMLEEFLPDLPELPEISLEDLVDQLKVPEFSVPDLSFKELVKAFRNIQPPGFDFSGIDIANLPDISMNDLLNRLGIPPIELPQKPNIPDIVIGQVDVDPTVSSTSIYKKDDLPIIERLSLTNPPYVRYLHQWLTTAKPFMGLP